MSRKHIDNWLSHFKPFSESDILCEVCGRHDRISFHHLLFRSHNGSDDVENVMALCNLCHMRAHLIKQPHLRGEELQKIHNAKMEAISRT